MKRRTLGLGLVALLMVSTFLACGKPKSENVAFTTRPGSALQPKVEEVAEEEQEEPLVDLKELYIVEDVDMTEENMTFYAIGSGKQVRYPYSLTTAFKDKYGNSFSIINFTKGSVVELGDRYDSNGALSYVKMSPTVWVHKDVSKFSMDSGRNVITIGDTKFRVKNNTRVYSDSERISIWDITDNDSISVTGVDNELVSVAVTTGHGYLNVYNSSLFNNSLIFVGNKIVTMLYGDTVLEVPEGTYNITVANDGWGGTAEFTVERNETTDVDLDKLKGDGPSFCDLMFDAPIYGTMVYLDGERLDTSKVHSVRYGAHKLKVVCEGYDTWSKTLVVNSPSATISLIMEESDDSSSTQNQNSTGTSTDNNTENNSTDSNNTENNGNNSTDYEVDYLTTLSDLLTNMLN